MKVSLETCTLKMLFHLQSHYVACKKSLVFDTVFPFTVTGHEKWVRTQPAAFSKVSICTVVPCEINVFVSVCLVFYASLGYKVQISQLPRDQLTPHFLPIASNKNHSRCVILAVSSVEQTLSTVVGCCDSLHSLFSSTWAAPHPQAAQK